MHRQSGFSVVELAIALGAIFLLLGGMLVPLGTQDQERARSATREGLGEIRDAMIDFAVLNGRLPCPDTDEDGYQDFKSGKPERCKKERGFVPWRDLGVAEFDAWDHHVQYRVTKTFSHKPGSSKCKGEVPGLCFDMDSEGDMRIRDAYEDGATIAEDIPAVLLSRAANWSTPKDELDKDEKKNYDLKKEEKIVSRDFSDEPGNRFDDIVEWIPLYLLKMRMVEAGRLP